MLNLAQHGLIASLNVMCIARSESSKEVWSAFCFADSSSADASAGSKWWNPDQAYVLSRKAGHAWLEEGVARTRSLRMSLGDLFDVEDLLMSQTIERSV
jgi:hypothetical protein